MVEIKSDKGGCIVSAKGSAREIALDVVTGIHALYHRLVELNPDMGEKFKMHFENLSGMVFLNEEEVKQINKEIWKNIVESDWGDE